MTTETAKKTYEIFNRVYKTGEPTKIFDWEFIKKDKTKVDVEISVSLIRNSKEQGIGFRGIVRDIGKRKRIEAALQKAHNELLEVNMELEVKTSSLEEVNTALKILLEKRNEDKVEIEERLLLNINEMILPYLEKLRKSRSNELQQSYADILESNLKEITSPFYQKMASDYYHLTPKEIQIAGLIKQGKTTKEIAELIQSSPRAIEFHRNNLRKKFGLTNTKTNLMTHLLTLN
jgi:DNA-binding CsgD family transcriptional regulator